jgi:hypothetical protein
MGPHITVDVAQSNYNPPSNYWNFVPRRYIGNPNWHNYYVDGSRNITIINNTTIINNYSGTNRSRYAYAPGPDPVEVRRYSGNNFTPVQLRQANTPGARMNGSEYVIYHPQVNATAASRGNMSGRPSTPAPARYDSYNNARPSTQYPANNQPVNNNPRPVASPAVEQPANNQPVNNNPRPVASPAVQQPANNQPVNNNPRPVASPAVQNPNTMRQHVQPDQPTYTNPNERKLERYNQNPASEHPAQNSPSPQRTTTNHPQVTGHPSMNPNPNNGHPVQRPVTPENKPAPKPAEQPKTREANNNG